MREFKFRAWDKEHNKIWLMRQEGESVEKCTGVGYEDEVVKLPIMQYTGLKDKNRKDKNRKEIYEGDIVQIEDGRAKVIFEDGTFKFEGYCNGKKEVVAFYEVILECYWIEVIGNIYGNSKLLK